MVGTCGQRGWLHDVLRSAAATAAVGALVVSLVATFLIAVPTSPASAAVRVPGIDVSKWQGDVDWADVASTPVRFVIMRATIGNTASTARSVDPKYAEYLAGATANGLVVGAYHRANVGRAEDDARNEANFFVNNAQIAAGDVLPVLDIEMTHGLSVAGDAGLGARVGPTGVRADRREADDLLEPELLADEHGQHAVVRRSRLPAVDRPLGCVRTDRARGELGRARLDVLAVDLHRTRRRDRLGCRSRSLQRNEPGAGEGRVPRGHPAGRRSDHRRPDRLRRRRIHVHVGSRTPTRWSRSPPRPIRAPRCSAGPGRAPRPARRRRATCRCSARRRSRPCSATPSPSSIEGSGAGTVTSTPARLDCGTTCAALFAVGSTVTLTAEADSASTFAGWSGACSGTDPVCSFPVSSPTDVVATFESVVSVEEDGAGAGYAWGRSIDAHAVGGSYRWERRAGASATYAFSGGAVTLFTVSGPSMGKARIRIDGASMGTIDGYAPALTTRVKHRYEDLGPGAHVLTVEVLGTKRPAAVGDPGRGGRAAVGRADPRRSSRVAGPMGEHAACLGQRGRVRGQRRPGRGRQALVHGDRRVAPRVARTGDGQGGGLAGRRAREGDRPLRADLGVLHGAARVGARRRSAHGPARRARHASGCQRGERGHRRPLARRARSRLAGDRSRAPATPAAPPRARRDT